MRTALKKDGLTRAVSLKKPPITEATQQVRPPSATEHVDWTQEQWDSIL